MSKLGLPDDCPIGRDGWPKYSRELRSGNRDLQWPHPDTDRKIGIRRVLPGEPKGGYATRAEAILAFGRFMDALRNKRDYTVTVKGFAELWSDPRRSPWQKAIRDGGKRGDSALTTLGKRVSKFVQMYPDVPMAKIARDHVQSYSEAGGAASSFEALALMWRDAASEKGGGIVTTNPFETFASHEAERARDRRKKAGIITPEPHQIAALLDAAYSQSEYPDVFAAWLELGQETGARTGELDVFRFDHLLEFADGTPGYYIEHQWNVRLKQITDPKHDSDRKIALSPRAVEIIESMRPIAEQYGSPYVFTTSEGRHYTNGYRDSFWSARDRRITPLRDYVPRLDVVGPKHQMKNCTRHYFTTQALREYNRAMLAGEPAVPLELIAKHLGHSDDGKTMGLYYAKLYAEDMQVAMAASFARQHERRAQDRRSQIRLAPEGPQA